MKSIILFALALSSIATAAAAAAVDNQTQAILQGDSFLQRDAFFQPQDYVFDYSPDATTNGGLRVTQQYGYAALMQIPQIPTLIGTSLGSTRFDLKPCALLQPHSHRSDVQIYVLEGRIRAGFVIQSFGKLIENTLDVGMGMILPRGSLMYFQNPSSKKNASFLATYSSNDFGVDLMASLFFHSLPSDITRSALGGLTQAEYTKIKQSVPDNQVYTINKSCQKQNS